MGNKSNCSSFFRFVFFLDPCNIDLINRKIKSIALCVSKCPSTELTTYSDLKQFALNNGEKIQKCKYFTEKIAHQHPYNCMLKHFAKLNM